MKKSRNVKDKDKIYDGRQTIEKKLKQLKNKVEKGKQTELDLLFVSHNATTMKQFEAILLCNGFKLQFVTSWDTIVIERVL